MLVQKKKNIYFAIALSLREISFAVYVHAHVHGARTRLMSRRSCAVGMCNAILRNRLEYIIVFTKPQHTKQY